MYEAPLPDMATAVMIPVKHLADLRAYVSLLEYNNIDCMILYSELSRRRIRSIPSLIKDQGISIVNNAIKACGEAIEKHKGKLVVKEAPRAVRVREDRLIMDDIEKLKFSQ